MMKPLLAQTFFLPCWSNCLVWIGLGSDRGLSGTRNPLWERWQRLLIYRSFCTQWTYVPVGSFWV